jgi:hypothetical protein
MYYVQQCPYHHQPMEQKYRCPILSRVVSIRKTMGDPL